MLNDLDRVLQDYTEHQNEIFQKFVTIMRERLQIHFRVFKTIDWKDDGEYVAPFIGVIKETVTLHRVLSQILSAEQVKQVFASVFGMFYSRIVESFAAIDVPNHARSSLLREVGNLVTTLRTLDNTEDPENKLGQLEDHFKKPT